MAAPSAIDELRKDHDILRRDMEALVSAVRSLGQDPQAIQEALSGSLRERLAYLYAGMRLHFRREEEGLFPDARRMVSEGARKVDILGQFFGEEAEDDFNAHAELGIRMEEMMGILEDVEAAGRLDDQVCARLRTVMGLVRSLLDRHAAKEDTLVFPMIERSLTSEQRDAVLDRLAAITPDVEASDPRMRQADGLSGPGPAEDEQPGG